MSPVTIETTSSLSNDKMSRISLIANEPALCILLLRNDPPFNMPEFSF